MSMALASTVACSSARDPHTASAEPVRVVPLRSLQLFETGVGYFERAGTVDGTTLTALPVPASHLDDALKSLVIVGPSGGPTIAALEFGSSLSSGMARAQAGLPLDATATTTYRDLLKSVQGEPVEIVTLTGSILGRIVEVIDAPAPPTGKSTSSSTTEEAVGVDPTLILLVVTDTGAIVRVATRDVRSVRPIDAAFPGRIAASLDSLGTRSAQVRRMVKLLASGKGEVTFGYIAETPLWRPSYRLVLDQSGDRPVQHAMLQGWALIHNDTDEDWRGVSVKLVNGRPDSFLFPLAAPRYFKRPLAHPEQELSTVPQLMGKTPDAIWGDHTDEVGESYGMGSIGAVGYGSGSGGYGHGYGSGYGHSGGVSVTVGGSSLLQVGDLAALAVGEGIEGGALFRYSLGTAMDLGAHSSALVPFLSQSVDLEVVSWFDSPSDSARSTARFTNSTTQTLPAGTVALFEASATGGFVGESAIPRLQPGQRRFVQYGADLDLELALKQVSHSDVTKRIVFERGGLEEHYLSTNVAEWTFDNRAGAPRRAFVLLGLRDNASITGADALDFDTSVSKPIVIVVAAPRAKTTKTITTTEGLERSTTFDALTVPMLEGVRDKTTIPAEEKAVIVDAIARAKELAEARAAREKVVTDAAVIEKDLVRWREDLRATSGAAVGSGDRSAVGSPFVARILAAEDKLALTRKAIEAADAEVVNKREALRKTLERLVPK
ncbi:MAG: hypothetical protein ACHREM_06740 [Polyangiales bacterium]